MTFSQRERRTTQVLSFVVVLTLTVLLPILSPSHKVYSQTQPSISQVDRTRLAEAFRLGDQVDDQIWSGWSKAPFAVMLVTPEIEFLIRHPKPPAEFTKLAYDSVLKSDVYYRKRTMSTSFLATFPVGMISTIVVGQAENTWVKTSTPWVITLLHEHFHQLQDSQPTFYADVNALNLSKGDQTGMWMLNYAFPYDKTEVQDQFRQLSDLLAEAIHAPKSEGATKVRAYLDGRKKFQALLAPDDYKYFAFQSWKEGIARYTEYHVSRLATTKFRASKDFRSLKDYRSFADVMRTTHEGIFRQLQSQKLAQSKRDVVYSFGAAEGLLLDKVSRNWRKRYFVEKFDLLPFFPAK
jgi:hypothetical protein